MNPLLKNCINTVVRPFVFTISFICSGDTDTHTSVMIYFNSS